MTYFSDTKLSEAAEELVHFDMDSIRQVIASQHGSEPEIWLADPESYETNGRVLRDSPSSRLLAYSSIERKIYATDGCNSCTRRLEVALELLTDSALQAFAEDNELRVDLLERLIQLI